MRATAVRMATRLVSRARDTAASERYAEADEAGTDQADRGDVPGWVLVTLMTAGLVILIWGLAGPALANLFNDAIARVAGGV